jgi:hypothetical protein
VGESPYQDLVDARGAFGGFEATVTRNDRTVRALPVVRDRQFLVRHELRATYLSWLRTTELTEVTGSAATSASRPAEADITYDAAEAVRVCVAEMNRLGVPSPEDLRAAGQTGISG